MGGLCNTPANKPAGGLRLPFPADFPEVVIHRRHGSPIRFTEHPDYAAAKAGDPLAASRFVDAMITADKLAEVQAMIGTRRPIVVAVHAEEATGRNAIPERYAWVLSRDLDLPLDDDIVQANRPRRTGQSGEYRLGAHATFDGVVESGRDYLLVDDNITQGGTLADLRAYIEGRGGNVIGATTLTGSRSSEILAPRTEVLVQLRTKATALENRWKEVLGYGFDALTHGEANYLLRSPETDALGNRVLARAQEGTAPQVPGDRPGAGAEASGSAAGGRVAPLPPSGEGTGKS